MITPAQKLTAATSLQFAARLPKQKIQGEI